MQKAHDSAMNEYWRNKPDLSTPIMAEKKNQLEVAVDTIDNRVIVLDTTKANQTDMLQAVKTIAYTESTGTFRITFFNDTYMDIDTDLEKLAVNFDYDDNPQSAHYQNLIITLDDGTVKYVDLSALITQYEFLSTSTIQAVVGADGSVSFNVINGSITEEKLEPNFLANCRIEVAKAQGYADSAEESAEDSEAWAVGKRNGQDVPSTDETYHNNAKYWAEQAEGAVTGNDKVTWEANGVLGAKNLIPYPYYESNHTESGITWTVNSDGSVTANGTATANSTFILRDRTEQIKFVEKNTSYFLSGCPIGGSNSKYSMSFFVKNEDDSNVVGGAEYGNGRKIDMPNQDYYGICAFARVFSGQTVSNLTFKPMLRLAEDTDRTYQPYAKTNKELTDEVNNKVDWATNGKLGAKNLLFYPYPFTFPQTNHGITFTDNNGVIETSGTQDNQDNSKANVFNAWGTSNSIKLEPNTNYIISGCPSGGGESSYALQSVLTDSSNHHIWLNEFGAGLEFTTDSTHLYFGLRIIIIKGYTGQLPVFKPMLRLAEDTDPTYQPYAMTNRELTVGKADKTDIATVESGTTASRAYSVGELVYVSGTLYRVKTAIASGATFTVGTNVEITNVSEVLKNSIKMVYDQYFTVTGTGAAYIDMDKDYPVDGYKLIGLTIASNTIGYVTQARIRNASRITGFVQKVNGGVITTRESVQVGLTLTYMKI